MNRMIKMFQQRADSELDKFLRNREAIVKESIRIDTPEWQAAVLRGADLKARAETWAKAAELLRQEELRK